MSSQPVTLLVLLFRRWIR